MVNLCKLSELAEKKKANGVSYKLYSKKEESEAKEGKRVGKR
jgi:hypothetical protein